eukprot:scaffold30096_cov69-Phaeocystis_antarctica.AAC.1
MKIGSHRSGRCWAHDARCSAQSSAWWAVACKATCLVCLGARHARPGAPWVAVLLAIIQSCFNPRSRHATSSLKVMVYPPVRHHNRRQQPHL